MHQAVEGRRVPRGVDAGRRRARHHRHPDPRHRDQARRRPRRGPLRLPPQVNGFINSSYPNTMSAVHMALAYLIDPRTPKNRGTFRPVTVMAQAGHHRVAVPARAGDARHQSLRAGDRGGHHQGAARSCPDRVIAGWARRFRIAIKGVNPRTRRPFIWHLFHARPGGGASPVGRRVGDGGRGAGGGRDQVRQRRGRGEPLPAVLRAPRVPSRLRAATGSTAAASGSVLRLRMETKEPGSRQHRGRRRAASVLRHPRRRGRPPHRYRLLSEGPERELKTKEVGVPVMPGDVFLVESAAAAARDPPATAPPASATAPPTSPTASAAKPRRAGSAR